MKRVIRVLIIIIAITTILPFNIIYASNGKSGATEWASQSPEWWKPTSTDVGQKELTEKANVITTAIRNIGIVAAVIALMIIGFRQMTASAQEKSILKEALPGYIIGVVLVVTVTLLPSLIYTIVKQMK